MNSVIWWRFPWVTSKMILLEVVAFQGDARVETARRDPDTGPWKATKRWFSEARKSHQIALILKELLVKDNISNVGRKQTISNTVYCVHLKFHVTRWHTTEAWCLISLTGWPLDTLSWWTVFPISMMKAVLSCPFTMPILNFESDRQDDDDDDDDDGDDDDDDDDGNGNGNGSGNGSGNGVKHKQFMGTFYSSTEIGIRYSLKLTFSFSGHWTLYDTNTSTILPNWENLITVTLVAPGHRCCSSCGTSWRSKRTIGLRLTW